MTNEDIMRTTRNEIRQAQQPLLERIDVLEKELDEANEHISVHGLIMQELITLIPVGMLNKTAINLRLYYAKMPEEMKNGDAAYSMVYWIDRFDQLYQHWQSSVGE